MRKLVLEQSSYVADLEEQLNESPERRREFSTAGDHRRADDESFVSMRALVHTNDALVQTCAALNETLRNLRLELETVMGRRLIIDAMGAQAKFTIGKVGQPVCALPIAIK